MLQDLRLFCYSHTDAELKPCTLLGYTESPYQNTNKKDAQQSWYFKELRHSNTNENVFRKNCSTSYASVIKPDLSQQMGFKIIYTV